MARLGQQVDVHCGRCKMERYHTVAALGPQGQIERVVCGYCQTARNYKDPTSTPARRSSTTGERATRTRTTAPTLPTSPPRPYAATEHFDKGDFLEHPKYGLGRVVEVRGDRVDVKFSLGESRVFVHRA